MGEEDQPPPEGHPCDGAWIKLGDLVKSEKISNNCGDFNACAKVNLRYYEIICTGAHMKKNNGGRGVSHFKPTF